MQLPRLIAKATKWPTFLYRCLWGRLITGKGRFFTAGDKSSHCIFLLYWSVAFVAVSYHIKWLKLRGRRNDVLGWSSGMKWWLRIRVLKVGEQDLYRGKCVYLFNHRSWADFVVDQYVTEGRSLFMSRMAVLFVFPTFMGAIKVLKSVILFKRGSIADKEKFNNWIDEQRASSPQPGLSVYPEGHRSMLGESLPLKRGMLHYAYSRKLPVQCVIGANKEAIIAEKHRTARLNQTAVVGYSAPIMTAEYPDFESFWAKVQQTWDDQWQAVFGAEWEGLRELQPREPDTVYPLSITLNMLFMVALNISLFVCTMWLTFRCCRWVLAFFGPLQPAVVAAVASYLALSVWLYSQPVNALQVHAEKLRPGKLAQSVPNLSAMDKKAS